LHVIDPASGETIRDFETAHFGPEAFAMSPDGTAIAFDDGATGWAIANVASGARRSMGEAGETHSAGFSPDGALLVLAGPRRVRIVSSESGERVHDLPVATTPGAPCAFTPDAASIVTIGDDASLRVWDAESGDEMGVVPLPAGLTCLTLHPFSPVAACGDAVGGFHILDLGFELGPLVATPVDDGSGAALRCPACAGTIAVDPGGEASESTCSTSGCGTRIRVNPFVLKFPSEPLARDPAADEGWSEIRPLDPDALAAESMRSSPTPQPSDEIERTAALPPSDTVKTQLEALGKEISDIALRDDLSFDEFGLVVRPAMDEALGNLEARAQTLLDETQSAQFRSIRDEAQLEDIAQFLQEALPSFDVVDAYRDELMAAYERVKARVRGA
jgi:hypothetical protein